MDGQAERTEGIGGGEGRSPDTAIVIEASDEFTGTRHEYRLLTRMLGEPDTGWRVGRQRRFAQDGRHFEEVVVLLADGSVARAFFDITSFIGKFPEEIISAMEQELVHRDSDRRDHPGL